MRFLLQRDSLASSIGGESASESSSIISLVSSIHDVASFTQCLETTLAWLLGARETFDKMEPVADDVEVVKRQFRVHEVRAIFLCSFSPIRCCVCLPLRSPDQPVMCVRSVSAT